MTQPEAIGTRIKTLRKERGLSLADLAEEIGVSEATLSRVENGQSPVSAHHLYRMAGLLGTDITSFFEETAKSLSTGIRSVCRKGDGVPLSTARYEAQVLCTDIAAKRMHPAIDLVTITSLDAAGGYSRHAGEEFIHVLDGDLLLVTEFYEPLPLAAGDSVYFDSQMGHAYLSADGRPVRILVIATTEPPK